MVLGLGNPILTDDGVGVLVAAAVRAALPRHAPIDISELSVGGLDLMERMVAYKSVILVDAMVTGRFPPGTVVRMDERDLRSLSATQHSRSPHDATLADALDLGRRLGLQLPEDIVVVAVEVENVVDFGETPTPAVAAALPSAVETVVAELARLKVIPAGGGAHGLQ